MMVTWRSTFDGDLEKVMIVSAVVDQRTKALGFADQSCKSYLCTFLSENVAPPTNVQ